MKTSGVYSIINRVTNDSYVGRATDLAQRKHAHWSTLRKGTHGNLHLQRAWNKYGEQAFEFFAEIECSQEDAIQYEQWLLDSCVGTYNISRSAKTPGGGWNRGKSMSDEQKQKLRASWTDERRARMGEGIKSWAHTDEARRKMAETKTAQGPSEAQIAWRRRPEQLAMLRERNTSPEHRAKVSAALLGHETAEGTRQKISLANREISRVKKFHHALHHGMV